jgi:anti-sigma factor RsiW
MLVRCDDVADLLPGILDGSGTSDRRVTAHVESCLRCQAELVQYRRLLRVLRQLRSVQPPVPVGLLGDVLVALEEAGERGAIRSALSGRRGAYLGGLAVAVGAAGAAGTIVVLASRARSEKIKLAG